MDPTQFNEFLSTQGISPEMWNSYSAGERSGILDSTAGLGGLDKANLLYGDMNGGNSWMDSLGGMDGVRAGLGIGQLGLGIMGFLDQKKTAKLQRNLLNQQIENNRFALDTAKTRQKDISGAFGGSAPGGLAASSAAPAPRL